MLIAVIIISAVRALVSHSDIILLCETKDTRGKEILF
jgi:hypothetical protein